MHEAIVRTHYPVARTQFHHARIPMGLRARDERGPIVVLAVVPGQIRPVREQV